MYGKDCLHVYKCTHLHNNIIGSNFINLIEDIPIHYKKNKYYNKQP